MKISATALKYFAIIIMTIDHIAFMFVPADSLLYFIMRIIGRMTAPILCFFIAEGFRYTRSRKNYLLRMAIFAVIAQPAYYFMVGGLRLNVMYTFAVSLVMLMVIECKRINGIVRALLIALCFCLSMLGDWGYILPLWILLFYRFKGDFRKQALFFFSVSAFIVVFQYLSVGVPLYQLAVLLAIIPLSLYNGERGKANRLSKWFFYVYYCLHIAVLIAIKNIIY